MIQCTKCKCDIPDDSWYCDQCGEQLMFCPKCADGKPKRGKRCTQCGSVLVPGDQLGKTPAQTSASQSAPQTTSTPQHQTAPSQSHLSQDEAESAFADVFKDKPFGAPQPQHSGTMRPPQPQPGGTMRGPNAPKGGTMRGPAGPKMQPDAPSRLVKIDDSSKVVVIKDKAIIGRTTGDYLDVFGTCGYVSSQHAKFQLHPSGAWLISDLDSTNGTFINSTQLEPNRFYKITKGMTIEIGYEKFKAE